MLMTFIKKVMSYFHTDSKTSAEDNSIELQRRYLKKQNGTNKVNDFIAPHIQSMLNSQGKSGFSGSAYNGPGKVDHEKRDSNMSQRNFEK